MGTGGIHPLFATTPRKIKLPGEKKEELPLPDEINLSSSNNRKSRRSLSSSQKRVSNSQKNHHRKKDVHHYLVHKEKYQQEDLLLNLILIMLFFQLVHLKKLEQLNIKKLILQNLD